MTAAESETVLLPDVDPDTPAGRLTTELRETIGDRVPAGVTLTARSVAEGAAVTLDCGTGIRLVEASDEGAAARLLLELCAALDDPGVRLGVAGEYDEVHLYSLLATASLDAKELIAKAHSLVGRVDGLREILT